MLTLREYLKGRRPKPFKPGAHYCRSMGDALFVWVEDVLCYGIDLPDRHTTIYCSTDDHRVVGFKVWSLTAVLERDAEPVTSSPGGPPEASR